MSWHAHDLVWLTSKAELMLAENHQPIPDWVLTSTGPVVVRRAMPIVKQSIKYIPVGVRGGCKAERCAAYVATHHILQSISPYEIVKRKLWANHPLTTEHSVFKTLDSLIPHLESLGRPWGITGSCGYELATGIPQLTPSSDLDLIIDGQTLWSKADASRWLASWSAKGCRLDIQLETPMGAVALAEWALRDNHVLVKSNHGPSLVSDPWGLAKESA
ncbi:malonate decarboxylase holo-ACP synthase [Neptunomonas phycophila]|uniref:Malonate decarboxylase holo-ACP synthase n=1 Tax=Neptunomonas phycophila TaxID=1572645 RepID=A0ABT9EQZ2_9GAMM|nr:malonate decarboxylase holo-ACP synthase [Neptunomonas phycophila]MDO6467023.1 malonate decarboxylase holo-ACP synthase [Neptunomonas phycophila]MDP2521384.1 malonate decarboxylase holo-ACP synthase [Neptunomonas phycophila]